MSSYLDECFRADYEKGILIWKERPLHHFKSEGIMNRSNLRLSGRIAGCIGNDGYVGVRIKGKYKVAHRIIWEMKNGPVPDGMYLDHINHDKADNRISNLRVVTRRQNNINTRVRVDNESGFKGVTFYKRLGKWMSSVSINCKRHYLGYFDTPELANEARQDFIMNNVDSEYYA
ncbi:TPA: HNH endonuclease [Serratia liquefaciens]|nr:HNH endonuclease [Serratia liquefaciens]